MHAIDCCRLFCRRLQPTWPSWRSSWWSIRAAEACTRTAAGRGRTGFAPTTRAPRTATLPRREERGATAGRLITEAIAAIFRLRLWKRVGCGNEEDQRRTSHFTCFSDGFFSAKKQCESQTVAGHAERTPARNTTCQL